MKTKIIGILVCMLLIATALPAVGTMNIKNDKNTKITDVTETVVFEDDFSSGLDPSKWTVIGNGGGIVEVVNGQLEIQCYEGIPTKWIGVRSSSFSGTITQEEPLIINLDMKTYVDHYGGYVGNQNIKLAAGSDSINIGYFRNPNELLVSDSGGNSVVLFTSDETYSAWPVEIQVFSTGGYKVTVNGYSTEITEPIILETSFYLELVVSINGDYPDYWWRCAFDNVRAKDITAYNTNLNMGNMVTLRLERLLDLYPNAFPILKHLMGL